MANRDYADLRVLPLTPRRWGDLEKLFGTHGAYEGCWCMWWRLRSSEFGKQSPLQRKRGLRKLIDAGRTPGLLAFVGKEPVAWCSIEPRECFAGLERSRIFKRVDDLPVWSISCFFVAKPYRRKGMMVALLRAAIEHARKKGAKIIEGYPLDPSQSTLTGYVGFTGIASAFRTAGFVEVARPDHARRIMRYYVDANLAKVFRQLVGAPSQG
jgi:GNAT superfamily N-acetyltransferase